MFCPMCGAVLQEVEKEEIDYSELSDQEISYLLDREDNSEKFICDNCNCFGKGYELVKHHPLKGMDSAPGDSWSLTWLK